jgi:hypothetical protein
MACFDLQTFTVFAGSNEVASKRGAPNLALWFRNPEVQVYILSKKIG